MSVTEELWEGKADNQCIGLECGSGWGEEEEEEEVANRGSNRRSARSI